MAFGLVAGVPEGAVGEVWAGVASGAAPAAKAAWRRNARRGDPFLESIALMYDQFRR